MTPKTQARDWTKAFGRVGWAVLAAVLVTGVAACNTTEGVGKDIESAGDGIKDAARDAKN